MNKIDPTSRYGLLLAVVQEAERDVQPLLDRLSRRCADVEMETCATEQREAFVLDVINLRKRMRWLVS